MGEGGSISFSVFVVAARSIIWRVLNLFGKIRAFISKSSIKIYSVRGWCGDVEFFWKMRVGRSIMEKRVL